MPASNAQVRAIENRCNDQETIIRQIENDVASIDSRLLLRGQTAEALRASLFELGNLQDKHVFTKFMRLAGQSVKINDFVNGIMTDLRIKGAGCYEVDHFLNTQKVYLTNALIQHNDLAERVRNLSARSIVLDQKMRSKMLTLLYELYRRGQIPSASFATQIALVASAGRRMLSEELQKIDRSVTTSQFFDLVENNPNLAFTNLNKISTSLDINGSRLLYYHKGNIAVYYKDFLDCHGYEELFQKISIALQGIASQEITKNSLYHYLKDRVDRGNIHVRDEDQKPVIKNESDDEGSLGRLPQISVESKPGEEALQGGWDRFKQETSLNPKREHSPSF
jgi:hypothetical protein